MPPDMDDCKRGVQAIREALTFDALVSFMEAEVGVWSIGMLMKDKRKAKTPRQVLEVWWRRSYGT